MIVFDASTIVSAALTPNGIPDRALIHAIRGGRLVMSRAVMAEMTHVLNRPKFARSVTIARRDSLLTMLQNLTTWFEPAETVTDCRDPRDDKYLELALAACAQMIVTGDRDLLVLNPWRSVRILQPAAYLELQEVR